MSTPEGAPLKRMALASAAAAAVSVVVAAIALVVAGRALFRVGQLGAPADNRPLDAPEFSVHDSDGDLRGRWTAQGLSLADKSGRLRASMSVGDDGAPTLALFGKGGRVRTVISLGAEDSPGITLHDDQSRVRARIVVDAQQGPSIVVFDDKGSPLGQLPALTLTPRPALTARKGR